MAQDRTRTRDDRERRARKRRLHTVSGRGFTHMQNGVLKRAREAEERAARRSSR